MVQKKKMTQKKIIQINSYSDNKYTYRYRKKKRSNTILTHKNLSN